MISILAIISSLLLVCISGLHFYWAFGGKWGAEQVLPSKEDEEKVLNPSWFITVLVGLVILLFALLYAQKSGYFQIPLPDVITKYGLKIVAFIFLVRAIGDFKYVGFTKKIKNTTFAKNDTKWYSPLCLFLGIVGFLVVYVGS